MRAKGRVAVAACMKEGGKNKKMTDDAVLKNVGTLSQTMLKLL
jgi:hypothetical protein